MKSLKSLAIAQAQSTSPKEELGPKHLTKFGLFVLNWVRISQFAKLSESYN